jgi:hypothetical protein
MSAEPHREQVVTGLTTVEEVGANSCAPPSSDGMATHTRQPPGPSRTRALLEEIAGGRRGAQIRAQVAAAPAHQGATPDRAQRT